MYVKFKGTFEGPEVSADTIGIAIVSAHKNYLIRITGGALAENFKKTEPELIKSINTFRFTDKKITFDKIYT